MNNKNVLIVEDDSSMLSALEETFSNNGFLTLTAADGETGLQLALKHKPNLIILDIVMPKMDGIAMLKKLRENNWGKFAPVIILTNLSENTKLAEALEIGVSEYLVKTDVTLKEIIEKSKRILGII